MAIPDYQTVMLPLLRVLADNNEYKIHEAAELIADKFGLTDEEKEELLPSGQGTVIRSRVGWAKTYMKNAGLVQQPKRGVMKITEEGLKVLPDCHGLWGEQSDSDIRQKMAMIHQGVHKEVDHGQRIGWEVVSGESYRMLADRRRRISARC